MADWVLRICFPDCPCCASYFSLRAFPQRGVCGRVKCKRGESALTSCLKAFCLDSFLPFRALITVCQKGKKIFMVGWSWLCVWEALTSDRNMGADIMPRRACVCERRGGGWSGWHFISRFSKGENLLLGTSLMQTMVRKTVLWVLRFLAIQCHLSPVNVFFGLKYWMLTLLRVWKGKEQRRRLGCLRRICAMVER